MPKAKTSSIHRNGKLNVTAKIRQLTKELAATKRELQVERRWRKKLQRAVLPFCPKWEVADLEKLKAQAVFRPSMQELLDRMK